MIDRLVVDLLGAKEASAKRELWRTMHALDEALQQLGWELAEAQARQYSGDAAARRVRQDADKYLENRSG